MAQKVVVVDPNPAVQAITAAALRPLQLEVHSLPESCNLIAEVKQLKPSLVLCAEELREKDGLESCKELLQALAARCPHLVLFVSSRNSETESTARSLGIETIVKPFKADYLRATAQKLLKAIPTLEQPNIALLIEPGTTAEMISHFLRKKGCVAHLFSTPEHITLPPALDSFSATITDSLCMQHVDWHNPETMGKLLVVANADEQFTAPLGSSIVTHPLSVKKLREALAELLPEDPSTVSANHPLNVNEQTLLAARISAVIFEKLLTQEALKHRRWEEACAQAGAVALRICREFK